MSTVKDLREELKDINEYDSELARDLNDFQKASKHALMTLGKTIQELADLEEEMKNPRKSVEERNKMLETGLNKAVKNYLSESQKVYKSKVELPTFLNRVYKVWERVDASVKDIKIKKAE
jgi:chromosome segregation ATPase